MEFENDFDSSETDSDSSSTLSDVGLELETVLDVLRPSYTSEQVDHEVDSILMQYGEHGSKQRLHKSISNFLRSTTPYTDFQTAGGAACPEECPVGGERMTDPESTELVTSLPFRVEQTFKVPADVTIEPSILADVNKIFEVQQQEAEMMLAYYCKKYGPEAIWRSGIRSLMLSRTEDLLRFPGETYLGLTQKQRSILSQAFEEFQSITDVERRLLALAADVHPAIVDEYWRSMTKRRLPYAAMQVVATAKEMRKHQSTTQHSSDQEFQHNDSLNEK